MQGEIATLEMIEALGFPTGNYSSRREEPKFAVVMVRKNFTE